MTSPKFKIPQRRHAEQYYDAADRIEDVLRRHLVQVDRRRLQHLTYDFMENVQLFESDFWGRESLIPNLEALPRLLVKAEKSFEAIPQVVKEELIREAGCHQEEAIERFKKETTKDIIFKSELPGPDATEAMKALQTIADHHSKLAAVFEKVKRELPAGMPTRNRPGEAYSVIFAALEICKIEGSIKAPKSVDESGPFYRLVKDLFLLFGITTAVRGAYKGWMKNMANKYEDLDLMPI